MKDSGRSCNNSSTQNFNASQNCVQFKSWQNEMHLENFFVSPGIFSTVVCDTHDVEYILAVNSSTRNLKCTYTRWKLKLAVYLNPSPKLLSSSWLYIKVMVFGTFVCLFSRNFLDCLCGFHFHMGKNLMVVFRIYGIQAYLVVLSKGHNPPTHESGWRFHWVKEK